MSSPFQRSFSSKSPLNQEYMEGYKKIIDPHSGGVPVDTFPVGRKEMLPEPKLDILKEVKPTLSDELENRMRIKREYAEEMKMKYGDVMDKHGKPILNPVRLLTSNKFNYPRWEGQMMDAAVELGKNVIIPGRLGRKIARAYDYKQQHRQGPW